MLILKDLITKKKLSIKKVCNRIFLESKYQKAKELLSPVNYFVFSGDMTPNTFIPAKLFEFSNKERKQKIKKEKENIENKPIENIKPIKNNKNDLKSKPFYIKEQVLPPLNTSAKSPLDCYKLDLMFPEEVITEARENEKLGSKKLKQKLLFAIMKLIEKKRLFMC